MPSPTFAAPAALPAGIEIFRAGRHTDDAGTVHQFSEADLDGMAASYDPALREAPLTVGHPQDNLPAYGWVKSVARTAAGALAIDTHQVEPQFAEMVQAGRFKKRSASFYPPQAPNNPTPGQWYLRHVAFLGAQPPAIAGLEDIRFCAGEADGAVSFSEPVAAPVAAPATNPTTRQEGEPTMTEQELNALRAELADAKEARAQAEASAAAARCEAASFAEKARADRKAGFVSFCEAQVQAGRLLPKDQTMAVATLDVLADAQPVAFAEGDSTRKVSPAQWLQDLIAGAVPVVSFGEFAPGGRAAAQIQPGAARGKSDAEIDQAARTFMHHHKVDYAEALGAVTASFTTTTTA